jgi:hypothetical protein
MDVHVLRFFYTNLYLIVYVQTHHCSNRYRVVRVIQIDWKRDSKDCDIPSAHLRDRI